MIDMLFTSFYQADWDQLSCAPSRCHLSTNHQPYTIGWSTVLWFFFAFSWEQQLAFSGSWKRRHLCSKNGSIKTPDQIFWTAERVQVGLVLIVFRPILSIVYCTHTCWSCWTSLKKKQVLRAAGENANWEQPGRHESKQSCDGSKPWYHRRGVGTVTS